MLTLFLLLVGGWVVLALLLTAWSMYIQATWYTEPATGLVWRGPTAAVGIMAVVALWMMLDFAAPGRYRPFWEFSSTEESKFFPEIRVPNPGSGREDVYKLRPGTRGEYRLGGLASGRQLPTRPPEIIILDGAEKSIFKPERDEKGNFKQRTTTAFGRETKQPLRYVDERGRVMLEDSLGQLATFRGGWFFGNLFLNALLLIALFAALWLLLRFQWPHALGQAVVLWLLLLLFALPPLLTQVEEVAQERAAASSE